MGIHQNLILGTLLFVWGLCSNAAYGGVGLRFLKTPPLFSPSNKARFEFEVLGSGNGIKCKFDDFKPSNCEERKALYKNLLDGYHKFQVCLNGTGGVRCASYNWTIDTVPPTAQVSVASPFTNASNVTVDISFSEPCKGKGGFQCSVENCNLLVYGAGAVVPSTLKILEPGLKYSLDVKISSDVEYGRLVMVMDRDFCTDTSGNRFTRSTNSSFLLHFDKRSVSVNVSTRIRPRFLVINNNTRTVQATNKIKNLKVYLHFSVPVLNSSYEIQKVLHTSTGVLSPSNTSSLGNRRFGFLVQNVSRIAVVSISLATDYIISRQGTPVSPTESTTFLYDAERPSVMLRTSSLRTREHNIPVVIKFVKPIFDFNSSAILISGGHLRRFREVSRSIYTAEIQMISHTASIQIPENTTGDVAGNKNLASNLLEVRHYPIPIISSVLSAITTITFAVTAFAAALLAISTARLLSCGALAGSPYFASEPTRNVMRIVYHIQVLALSKWLVATVPIEYYEFARGIGWSIPYLSLPWNTRNIHSLSGDIIRSSGDPFRASEATKLKKDGMTLQGWSFGRSAPPFGAPLTLMEYMTYFENQNMKPEAKLIQVSQGSDRWENFNQNMFWLAVIGGGLMMLHILLLFALKFRRKGTEKTISYGALTFPRFEIFLVFLALPCVCQASTTAIKGGTTTGVIVGIFLLGISSVLLISLLLFVSIGITMGKLLLYKEIHREGQELHWYRGIMRASFGPGKRSQWTWKDQTDSVKLTKLGPLFEDLRGPPKYMVSQIATRGSGSKLGSKIIASDDETEDAEAPLIEKLFGTLRIYYVVIESVKRVSMGIAAGLYSDGISSRTPLVVVLSIASFQLLFLVLKKPFVKKKVQFVEILSVTGELGIIATCYVVLEKTLSETEEQSIGIFMLTLFAIGFFAQIVNEWYALFEQVRRLSPDENSFSLGSKTAFLGIMLILLPMKMLSGMDDRVSSGGTRSGVSSGSQSGQNSGGIERSWVRQLREIAKDSFSREDKRISKDPSTSQKGRTRSSSISTSSDFKEKSKSLHKDLEAIFSASK